MAAAIGLRGDFDAGALRRAAKRSKDGPQARRLLALLAIYEGATRSEAAKIGGVTLQIVRDWVLKLNAHGPDGLIDRKTPGQAPRLNEEHRAALAAIVESGPIPAFHGVVRWRIVDLCQWIFEEFRIAVSQQTLSRVLRKMGYRKRSARPRIMPRPREQSRPLKELPRAPGRNRAREARRSRRHRGLVHRRGADRPEEQIIRRWATRGTRPSAPKDQRTASAYIFGAISPKEGKGAALVMPRCDSKAMTVRLAEIATQNRAGRPRRPAARSGWLASLRSPDRPAQHHARPLPAKRPELNPQENVWQFMRGNWLSNRVFKSYDQMVDLCCDAWNKLVDQPWRIIRRHAVNYAATFRDICFEKSQIAAIVSTIGAKRRNS